MIKQGRSNSFGITVHGGLSGLAAPADDHTQYALLAGRAGGQVLFGGTAAGNELRLRGTSNANLGLIRAQSPITFDDVSPAASLATFFINATPAQTIGGFFSGGATLVAPVIDLQTGFFSWSGFTIAPDITSNAAVSFATFRLIDAQPKLRGSTTASGNPLGCEIVNGNPQYSLVGAVTRALLFSRGLHYRPGMVVSTSGGQLDGNNHNALEVAVSGNAATGATCNVGTVRGVYVRNVALSGGGTTTLAAIYGVDFDSISSGGNVPKVVVRSALTAATNAFFLQNNGGAQSDFGTGAIRVGGLSTFDGFVDLNKPVALGGGAVPTLGTIGGSGPTTAAQAQWVQIDVNGVAHWIAAWT